MRGAGNRDVRTGPAADAVAGLDEAPAAALSLENLTRRYGETVVLDGVSLEIRAGEFLTLVGPSGCGKSTLLRTVAGLERADAGRIRMDGIAVDERPAAARDLAMVFQSYALYPHLSVEENLLVPLRMRRLSRLKRLPLVGAALARTELRAMRSDVHDVAAALGLEPLLARRPGSLSGGQRQRVALGRAMVRRPRAFLMDEPLSNLDAALRVRMRGELAELHRSLGATFLYVTHDQVEALTLSDRVAVMARGRILQFDTPERVYDDPASLEVARFIGTPTLSTLEATVRGDGGVEALGTFVGAVDPEVSGPLVLGLRPERLELARAGEPGAWSGRVVGREHFGADTFLALAPEAAPQDRLTVRSSPEDARGIGVGDALAVRPRPGAGLLFDAAGRRVRRSDATGDAAEGDAAGDRQASICAGRGPRPAPAPPAETPTAPPAETPTAPLAETPAAPPAAMDRGGRAAPA